MKTSKEKGAHAMKKKSVKRILLWELVVFLFVFIINIIMLAGINELSFVSHYIDMPSLIIILMFVIGSLWVSGFAKDFLNIFKIGKEELKIRQLKRTLEAVIFVQKMTFCGAGVFVIVGIIVILSELNSPELIGANLAVAILVLLYAIIIEIFLAPLKAVVQNEITDLMDVEDEEA